MTNIACKKTCPAAVDMLQVACYRNKIVNYRQGIETDLSEVLQTDRVFTNVSKGQFANSSDLRKAFGTTDDEEVCKVILTKGQVQVSDMERSAQLENTQREVAAMVSAKCVDPSSNRPYTTGQIRDAMREVGFMVHPTRSVKQQFLDCVRLLRERDVLRIERAKMELCVIVDGEDEGKRMVRRLTEAGAIVDEEGSKGGRVVVLIDPSLYRTADKLAKEGRGRMEILRQCVTEEGDVELESELQRKSRRKDQAEAAERNEGIADSSDNDNDAILAGLSRRMERVARISGADDDGEGVGSLPQALDGDEEDERAAPAQPINSRKQNRKAQKKSKKAKRREREAVAEREAKAEAERARQRERSERLGLGERENSSSNTNGSEDDNAGEASPAAQRVSGSNGNATNMTLSGNLKACNTCGGTFGPAQYRAHFRSDWHRFNVKLKMKGATPVGEEEFKLCDSDAFFEGSL
mmetsp:Transcript_40361/g.121609  ORF Transcript_40361/g.121609 Transcript_40361/m.121609 type:complete len:466 (-) Transcript_40361:124-1521(-)